MDNLKEMCDIVVEETENKARLHGWEFVAKELGYSLSINNGFITHEVWRTFVQGAPMSEWRMNRALSVMLHDLIAMACVYDLPLDFVAQRWNETKPARTIPLPVREDTSGAQKGDALRSTGRKDNGGGGSSGQTGG